MARRVAQIPFFRSLRFKIGFGYVILVAINISVAVWTVYNFGKLTQSLSILQGKSFENIVAVGDMARAVERHRHAITSILDRDSVAGLSEFARADVDFRGAFERSRLSQAAPGADSIMNDIGSTYEGFKILMSSLVFKVEDRRYADAKSFYYSNITPFIGRLSDNCFWLIEEDQKQIVAISDQTRKTTNEAVIAIISASLLAIILSVVTLAQFIKRIIEPAEKMTETVNQIGRGRMDLKIDVQTRDEIGELSREFNKMTERLRKFEALNIEQILIEKQKSEAIVGNITDAIIVCDPAGKVLLINHSAEAFLRTRESAALGRPLNELTSDERILAMVREPQRFKQASQPFVHFAVDGKDMFFRPQLTVLPTRSGAGGAVVLVLQDVTQFRELDRMKSDFMATVSHEFRTPLTSINIGVDILRQHLLGPLNASQEELLDTFKDDCNRLTKLVRELLQLSKLESGKLVQREESLDMGRIVENTVTPLRLQFTEKKVELVTSVEAGLPPILGDEQHMGWVVSNLATNALRHTPAGGKVEISAKSEPESILLQVRDTGEGIPSEFIDKIFDKFTQIKRSIETTPGSVGLGLSIAKDIVEMYGGKIWVESEIGKGSTFSVRMPVTQVHAA